MNIKYEDALSIVKNNFSKNLIRRCLEYDEYYHFILSQDDKYIDGDLTTINCLVSKDDGNIQTLPIGIVIEKYRFEKPKILFTYSTNE